MPIIRALSSRLHLVGPSLMKYSVVKMGAAVVAASAVEMEEQRLGVMFIILLVSLFGAYSTYQTPGDKRMATDSFRESTEEPTR